MATRRKKEQEVYQELIDCLDAANISAKSYGGMLSGLRSVQVFHHNREVEVMIYCAVCAFALFLLGS